MKKNTLERKADLDQLGIGNGFGTQFAIIGLHSQNSIGPSHHPIGIPKPPSQKRGRTIPKPF